MRSWSWVWCLWLVACAPSGSAEPAQTGGANPPPANKDESKELPADVAALLEKGPCVPRHRASLEQHVLTPEGAPENSPVVFIMGLDERLCVVGRPGDPSGKSLTLSAQTVEVAQASEQLVSIETKAVSIGTVMVVKNYHSRPLRYRAIIKPPGHEPQAASVCPVRPGLLSVEHWPHPIEVFSVGAFELLDAGSDMSCI
jgi:hypothetical protein